MGGSVQLPGLGTGPHSEGPQACSPPRQTPCRLGLGSRLLTWPCHRGGRAQARMETEKRGPSPPCCPPPGHTPPCALEPRDSPLGPAPQRHRQNLRPGQSFYWMLPLLGCEEGTLQTGTWDRPSSQHWSGRRVTGGVAVLSPHGPLAPLPHPSSRKLHSSRSASVRMQAPGPGCRWSPPWPRWMSSGPSAVCRRMAPDVGSSRCPGTRPLCRTRRTGGTEAASPTIGPGLRVPSGLDLRGWSSDGEGGPRTASPPSVLAPRGPGHRRARAGPHGSQAACSRLGEQR